MSIAAGGGRRWGSWGRNAANIQAGCCGSPCDGFLCVRPTDYCTQQPIRGAVLTVTDGSGNPVGTATTTFQATGTWLLSPGSLYTDGTGYPLAVSGGPVVTPLAGTYDVVAGKVANVKITSPGDYTNDHPYPVLSFPSGAGTGLMASGRAALTCQGCVEITSGGAYTGSLAIPGYPTATKAWNVPPTCLGDVWTPAVYGRTYGYKARIQMDQTCATGFVTNIGMAGNYPPGYLPGMLFSPGVGMTGGRVDITGPGGYAFTWNNDNTVVQVDLPGPGTYTFTGSNPPRYAPQSMTLTIPPLTYPNCVDYENIKFALSPADGYACMSGAPDPLSKIWDLTDSIYGPVVMEGSADGRTPGVPTGKGMYSLIGYIGVPFAGCPRPYYLPPCPPTNVLLGYEFQGPKDGLFRTSFTGRVAFQYLGPLLGCPCDPGAGELSCGSIGKAPCMIDGRLSSDATPSMFVYHLDGSFSFSNDCLIPIVYCNRPVTFTLTERLP